MFKEILDFQSGYLAISKFDNILELGARHAEKLQRPLRLRNKRPIRATKI
jgi:hypothetical protein